ncbi:MAG: PUR family DNA/RNA-binding protein [Cyclobacteriaceae bacterium]|nr:PUR family DNA/RNA-binding protein [Cyclobacteriaceae bacterium]
MDDFLNKEQKEIFSESVRAGKRTYFFDVKATRSNDYYLTITESKRRNKDDGYTYEKHKIFLYKEDFNKFVSALNKSIDHVKEELLPEVDFDKLDREEYYKKEDSSHSESNEKDDTTELKWD